LYESLFTEANPLNAKDGSDFTSFINPDSLKTLSNCRLEPSLANAEAGSRWQFERLGYFCVDSRDATKEMPVFNRTVTLRDTWAKIQKAQKKQSAPKKQKG
jgi:glutaminyl-tRNA synthetase